VNLAVGFVSTHTVLSTEVEPMEMSSAPPSPDWLERQGDISLIQIVTMRLDPRRASCPQTLPALLTVCLVDSPSGAEKVPHIILLVLGPHRPSSIPGQRVIDQRASEGTREQTIHLDTIRLLVRIACSLEPPCMTAAYITAEWSASVVLLRHYRQTTSAFTP
jgi:hypothetical protein